jgi:hypothetical protein
MVEQLWGWLGVVWTKPIRSGIVIGLLMQGGSLTVVKVQVALLKQKVLFPQFFSKFDAILLPDGQGDVIIRDGAHS